MERSPLRSRRVHTLTSLVLVSLTLLPSAGCLHLLIASGIYLWEGGKMVNAECEDLKDKRVVVVCRPPASTEYSHAGASRQITRNVAALLRANVPKIDMVDPREVDTWLDENDGDYEDLGRAVKADRVVVIELDGFQLYKGKTLYQGNADVNLIVHDMEKDGTVMWDRHLGEVLFPRNSAIPSQDKPEPQFQREFVAVLSTQIAEYFYRHDPNASFAIDAIANR